jgi:heterodisulfide reductase subunit B
VTMLGNSVSYNSEARERIWKRYIKEIPEERFLFLPSCILGVGYPGSEVIIPEVFNLLGLDWNWNLGPESVCTCCSGIAYHCDVAPIESTLLTTARLWSLAQEAGYESLAVSCVTSFGVHCECLDLYRHEAGLKKKMDKLLMEACGRKFELPKYIVHVSDVIYRHRLRLGDEFMVHKLVDSTTGRALRGVDHVGCHYNKLFPGEMSMGGAEYCEVLSGLVKAWGGDEVDYPERRHCCGMGFRQCMIPPNRSFTAASVNKKMESMEPFEPDFIITNCPGCQVHLDKQQWAIKELTGKEYFVPVLTYMELTGLLLGWDPYDTVGIQFHSVPVEPLLDKIGIPYDESKSWLGKEGQPLSCTDELRKATPAAGKANKGQLLL